MLKLRSKKFISQSPSLKVEHEQHYWDPFDDDVVITKKKPEPKFHDFSPSLLYSSALVGNSDYLDCSFDKFYHNKLPKLQETSTLELAWKWYDD